MCIPGSPRRTILAMSLWETATKSLNTTCLISLENVLQAFLSSPLYELLNVFLWVILLTVWLLWQILWLPFLHWLSNIDGSSWSPICFGTSTGKLLSQVVIISTLFGHVIPAYVPLKPNLYILVILEWDNDI